MTTRERCQQVVPTKAQLLIWLEELGACQLALRKIRRDYDPFDPQAMILMMDPDELEWLGLAVDLPHRAGFPKTIRNARKRLYEERDSINAAFMAAVAPARQAYDDAIQTADAARFELVMECDKTLNAALAKADEAYHALVDAPKAAYLARIDAHDDALTARPPRSDDTYEDEIVALRSMYFGVRRDAAQTSSRDQLLAYRSYNEMVSPARENHEAALVAAINAFTDATATPLETKRRLMLEAEDAWRQEHDQHVAEYVAAVSDGTYLHEVLVAFAEWRRQNGD